MRTSTARKLLATPVGLLLALTVVACQGSAPDHARDVVQAPSETTYFPQYGVSTHAYKPHRLNPSVDGSLYVARMHWTAWNNRRAVGTGIAHVNDCRPNCAAGHFTKHPVTVRLTQPQELCGSRFFTTIRLRERTTTPMATGPASDAAARWRSRRPKRGKQRRRDQPEDRCDRPREEQPS